MCLKQSHSSSSICSSNSQTPKLCKIQTTSDLFYNSLNVLPTKSDPQIACNCGAVKSSLVQFILATGMGPVNLFLSDFPFSRIPNLNPTSVTVTAMLTTMRTMIIQVIMLILVSAMLSLRISANSRKTLQRSLRTLIRGAISM